MTDLPSGTVTFLFTDIEGSTSLLFTPRLPDFVSKRIGNYQYNVYDAGVLLDQVWVC